MYGMDIPYMVLDLRVSYDLVSKTLLIVARFHELEPRMVFLLLLFHLPTSTYKGVLLWMVLPKHVWIP